MFPAHLRLPITHRSRPTALQQDILFSLLHLLTFTSLHLFTSLSLVPLTLILICTSSVFACFNHQQGLLCYFFLMVIWTPPPTTTLAKKSLFMTFLFSFMFVICSFWSWFFFSFFAPSYLSSIRPLHLFATVPILWGHHFTCVYFSFSPFSFCKSTLCAALALCVPLLFSSPSLATSQFRNYSSGLKQWW